jgi:hypothetical protein
MRTSSAMKTHCTALDPARLRVSQTASHPRHPRPARAWLFFLLLAGVLPLHAGLREPSNFIFGYITISNSVVGPERTDLVVEARLSPKGAPFASYRMGTALEYGNTYFLEIPVETPPVTNNAAVTLGAQLYVVLRDATGDLAVVNYQVTERGKFQRLDFLVSSTSDTNGLPDSWENAHFGAAGQDPNADPDHDGRSNWQEYVAGTNPLNPDGFKLLMGRTNDQTTVAFFVQRAEGPGYEGLARYYALQTATHPEAVSWQPVSGFTNIFGDNRTVVYVAPPGSPAPQFYRGQITLQNQ